jgi:N-methylhydantoinase A
MPWLSGINRYPPQAANKEAQQGVATRIGIDVGGTFTDLIFYDDASGEVVVAKASTTPSAPEQAVLALLGGIPVDRSRLFLHGTTVGLNALLERRGATVGLLATRGFRDVLEIRRGDRANMYDLFWTPPEPLVPRRLRLPISGRIRADGTIETPLDEEDVRRALVVLNGEGVDSIAVTFLNAYANPSHELAAEEVLRAAGFDGDVSLSHRVSGEYREYERTCTTVVDAFVRPRMSAYLTHVQQGLNDRRFAGESLVTRSGGGAMTFAEARERPFETILSGPVAGAQGAALLARTLGLDRAIAADVGGTSFDTCLIADGRAPLLYEGNVLGLPLQTPWIDVRTIGAGGGSIAYVDFGGLLRVGPRSAGASPGPASYGRGGVEPTTTDAALLLGMLGPGRLASNVQLDVECARTALKPLRESLGFNSEDDVARGVVTIAAAQMADAIREITVEQGEDPRQAALIGFGGAGPMFACLLARELGIDRIVIPPHAGNFSAFGLLSSDLTQTLARTRIFRLSNSNMPTVASTLGELWSQLETRGTRGTRRQAHLDLRYVGQEYSLTLPLPVSNSDIDVRAEQIQTLFESEYERTFGHRMDEAVEIVVLRASLVAPLPPLRSFGIEPASPGQGAIDEIKAFSFSSEEWATFRVLRRSDLEQGAELRGPAIVLEPTATTYLDAGFVARSHEMGVLVIDRQEDER